MSITLESTTTAPLPTHQPVRADDALRRRIERTIATRSFCTVATTSPAGRAHVAGVLYDAVDGTLWIHTTTGSRKARSVAANPHVGVCIPFRRLPFGPPYTIHFQARATVVAMDDPEVRRLVDARELRTITAHGALDLRDGCFLKLEPHGSVHSYGPGARVLDLIRDPLHHGAASFPVDGAVS